MEDTLNEIEARTLGSLIEKEMATPEYYPLSLNALINACNQKSNRNPVVSYDETTVMQALDRLKERKFVWGSDAGRVTKYSQNFVKIKNLLDKEAALICILLLRGPQTLGELRGRSDRLYKFNNLLEVEKILDSLSEMGMVMKLPKLPGRKESRYAHLLSGAPDSKQEQPIPDDSSLSQSLIPNDRIEHLENEILSLKEELTFLRKEFSEFKKQFE